MRPSRQVASSLGSVDTLWDLGFWNTAVILRVQADWHGQDCLWDEVRGWVGGRKAGECRQCSVCFCQDWCRGSLDWRPWGGRAMVMMWEICRHFSDSDVKIDGRVLEGGSLGMSVSSTPSSWLTGGAIRGGSRHLTRVACEEEVHEFFEHVTEITDPDYGLGNCCNRLFIVSGIPDLSGRIYYLLV